ncbi:histone-like nucleoid-structuring protein Lsr2 [Streptomyces sp. NPDC048362]|uniref:Lsr2 dimerization domain-containing protein n=1 Tax=Streptomyces sp. NPDC048362 TaxID=3365539 RepID=UPI0037154650
MEQKQQLRNTDDITGRYGYDVTKHTFSMDGIHYEIDLGCDSYQKLLDALSPFFAAAHRRAIASTFQEVTAGRTRLECRAARDWARKQGITVKPRGPIPKEVWNMYDKARRNT